MAEARRRRCPHKPILDSTGPSGHIVCQCTSPRPSTEALPRRPRCHASAFPTGDIEIGGKERQSVEDVLNKSLIPSFQ